MTRLPADPVGRLATLEAARVGVEPGLILNANEMATVAGMSWANLKRIVESDPSFPVAQRGDMGVSWQFDAGKVLDHMIGSAKAERQRREARRADVSRLAGLGVQPLPPLGGEAGGSGSAAERVQEARAINALIDAQAKLRLEKQKQGELIPRDRVRALLTDLMTTMQTETLAASSRMDPAGQWEPSFRSGVEEELRSVLTTVRDRLEKMLEAWRGPLD